MWSDRGVPVPQIMARGGDSACALIMGRSWCTSATDYGGNREGDTALRTAVEQIAASCHRSLRKSGRRYCLRDLEVDRGSVPQIMGKSWR